MRGTHQGQQSIRTAPTGRTHDCKRRLPHAQQNLLRGGGHPHMRRRDLLLGVGGAVLAPALAAKGQRSGMPVVGFLGGSSLAERRPLLVAFRQALTEAG